MVTTLRRNRSVDTNINESEKEMMKFYTYTSEDKIEYSRQIEKYLNNSKIKILDIQHNIDVLVFTKRFSIKLGTVRSESKLVFTAFITYEEL